MTININELRRLAQAATPGGWYVARGNYVYGCKEVTDGEEVWHPVIACTDDDEVSINFEGNANFIAAANPAVINELLDRLEAAENEVAHIKEVEFPRKVRAVAAGWETKCARLEQERDELRAKIERMEQQEPVGIQHRVPSVNSNGELVGYSVWLDGRGFDHWPHRSLYLAPGAQPAPESCPCCGEAMRVYARCLNAGCEAVMTTPEQSRYNKVLALMKTCATRLDEPPTPSIPEGWKPIPEEHQTFDLVDLRLADGSVLCGCVPQSDGDYWWEGPSGEVFIDPKYAPATHWRLASAPESKP